MIRRLILTAALAASLIALCYPQWITRTSDGLVFDRQRALVWRGPMFLDCSQLTAAQWIAGEPMDCALAARSLASNQQPLPQTPNILATIDVVRAAYELAAIGLAAAVLILLIPQSITRRRASVVETVGSRATPIS